MKVKCLSTSLTEAQLGQLRINTKAAEYQIEPGSTYLVLAITFMLPVEPHGGGVHYQILNDFGACRSIPASLFEIQDARCFRYWVAKQDVDGSLLLWPEEFYTRYFHDDLSEGEAEAVDAFNQVVIRMQSEFSDS